LSSVNGAAARDLLVIEYGVKNHRIGGATGRDHDRRYTIATVLAVPALAFALYGPALAAYLFEDDFQWLATSWTFRVGSLFDIAGHRHFYRPVIELYFYWGVRLFGDPTAAFHLFGVAVHAINGMLVYQLTRALTGRAWPALAAALVFVSLPGYVDAVAWVGAIAEPLVTLFGCLSVWWLIVYLRTGGRWARAGSVLAFALALLTHESAVMILPLLVLAHWVIEPGTVSDRLTWTRGLITYAPYLLLFAVYAVITVVVSRNNYLVEGGQYRIGGHAIRHVLDYIVSLYVGKKMLPSYVAIVLAVAILLWRGSRPVRFATAWVLLTLLPFAFFVAGNTSRYLYTPAVGFAMLLALALGRLDRTLDGRMPPRTRGAAVAVLAGLVVCRFLFFASDGVRNFVARADAYKTYLAGFRTGHPAMARGAIVPVPSLESDVLHETYVEAMINWEYRDPAIRLRFGQPDAQEH
jgi:hypothetical protein